MTGTRRGWFHLASGASVGRLLGFVGNLLLSRWLGPVDLGLFNLVSTTVQTGDTLVRCGGDFALNYELGGQSEVIQSEYGLQLSRAFAQLCSLSTSLFCFASAVWIWWGQGLFPASLATSQRFILSLLLLLMISSEGISASAWEVLLVTHRTSSLALRQGLFFPLRLLLAALGALCSGVSGAMAGWSLIAIAQFLWLKCVLGDLWRPLSIWPPSRAGLYCLLRRGLPFYAANLLASIIFYPLLLKVASTSGLSQVGYLRAGQILQQLFAFLPATLVPVLFLRLRREDSFLGQVMVIERPLRLIWFTLLEALLLYCAFDQSIITSLFGIDFESALLPTRFLLITALFECLAQLVVQPLLAAGKTRTYGLWQNGSAVLAAVVGWIWIPSAGLLAYLIVRLLYVIVPLIGFGLPVLKYLQNPIKILVLLLLTLSLLVMMLLQGLIDYPLSSIPAFYIAASILVALLQREDLLLLYRDLTVKP